MDQGEQMGQAPDEGSQAADEREGLLEDEDSLDETAAAPTPQIVEGTLVESTLLAPLTSPPSMPLGEEDQQHGRALRRWTQEGIFTVLVALLTVLGLVPTQAAVMRLFVSLVPAAGASATITLVADQVDLHRTYTLLAIPAEVTVPITSRQAQPQAQVEARLLTAPTRTQAITVPTTGRGHRPPTQAHGLVTFYNQAPTAQAISAGMLLTGADGIQVVTDQAIVVPAAHLPTQGQVTVAAHAVQAGPQGNIGVNDFNGLCCFAGIAVQNRQAFAGGANARDFLAVGAHDVSGAATPLIAILSSQGQAAVQAQVQPNEQLMQPVQCPSQVTATPAVGEEATQVMVRVRVACHAEVYNSDETQAQVTRLLHTQGIHQVTINTTDWWDDASHQVLPQDPNRILPVVISWAGM